MKRFLTTTLEKLSEHSCWGGTVGFYRHDSSSTACPMRFAVFTPPRVGSRPVPVLYYLAGLTCNEETFMIKAGAQRLAAELGLLLVAPDTSPRNVPLPGDSESWDFGVAAGFYLDATEQPWARHYRMESYVTQELPELIGERFPADRQRQGIFGHSMGGHGALTLWLRHPQLYRSVSAFAPIAAPSEVPWGQKAFGGYLGADRGQWSEHDACALMLRSAEARKRPAILIDQGLADQFLERQLRPERFEEACAEAGQALKLRRHPGYDHGYYFVASFIEDHLRHHARQLG
ncbi:MAG TPA: S-formylglutathione hydrolase [Steroidobacteraceae bacterium]|nr:S-formylglutathione hydrolase [Steroidobacteraceae bacterium]